MSSAVVLNGALRVNVSLNFKDCRHVSAGTIREKVENDKRNTKWYYFNLTMSTLNVLVLLEMFLIIVMALISGTLSYSDTGPICQTKRHSETKLACFRIYFRISVADCVKECIARQARCTHIRHNRSYRICSLCEDASNDSVSKVRETKRLFGDTVINVANKEMDMFSIHVSQECALANCSRTQKYICDTGQCKFSECEFPADVTGTLYPENFSTSVGAKTKFDCLDNRLGECPIIITCLPNATWSKGEITSPLRGRGNGNIALNQPTQQSSDWEGDTRYGKKIEWNSSKAVDGNKNPELKNMSCTHTKEEAQPWWRANLSEVYWISRVVLYNREDEDESLIQRLHDINVTVGWQDNMVFCGYYEGPGTRQNLTISIRCDGDLYGKIVQIQIVKGQKNVLTLCEVEIFSV